MVTFSKKLVSAISISALTFTALGTSFVSAASEFLPYAETLAQHGVINTQTAEAGYRLSDNITRAELAKVAANLAQYTPVTPVSDTFKDVKPALGDLYTAIESLAAAGVISTYFDNFRPNDNVTRAEMTKMLLGSIAESPSAVSAGYQDVSSALGDLEGFINRANELNIVQSATFFRPNANASRGEIFKVAAGAAGLIDNIPENPEDDTNTGASYSGSVQVSLVGAPAAQYVPMNASSVNVGTVKVTATKGDVAIKNITIARSGLGNNRNVTVSLAQDGVRISEARAVTASNQEAVIRLDNALVLKSGESANLDVLVSTEGDANSQHQFTLTAVDGKALSTPITLGLINTTSYEVTSVVVQNVNGYAVTSGRNDQRIGTVTLRGGQRDVTLSGFTVSKTTGTDMARAFSNLTVYKGQEKVGNAKVTSDKIIVTDLKEDLARNQTLTFDFRGDITYIGDGSDNDSIQLSIPASEDVAAVEKASGFTTRVDNSSTSLSGKVTFSKLDIQVKRNPVPSRNVSAGESNVVFLDSTLTAGASFDVTKYTLKATTSTTGTGKLSDTFSNLTLTVDGMDTDLLDPEMGLTNGAGTKIFNASADKFRIDSGSPVNVEIRGSLSSNAPNGNWKFELTLNDVKNLTTSNTTEINRVITGENISIKGAALNIRGASTAAPAANAIYSNTSDLEVGRFGLQAKSDAVNVNKITVTNTGTLASLQEVFNNARLIDADSGNTIASSAEITADKVTFNSVNVRVERDKTLNIKIVVDTPDVSAHNTKTFRAVITIAPEDTTLGNSNNPADVSGTAPTKTFTVGAATPSLVLEALTLDNNAPFAQGTITNEDTNAELTIETMEIGVSLRSTGDNNVTPIKNPVNICLREIGSNEGCDGEHVVKPTTGTGTDAEQKAGIYKFEGIDAKIPSFNEIGTNSDAQFELFIDENVIWDTGDYVRVQVRKIQDQSFVGTEGSTVTVKA